MSEPKPALEDGYDARVMEVLAGLEPLKCRPAINIGGTIDEMINVTKAMPNQTCQQ